MPFDEIALLAKIVDHTARIRLSFGDTEADAADVAAKAPYKLEPCNSARREPAAAGAGTPF